MAKKSVQSNQSQSEIRLTKEQVLGRMAEGLYLQYPEQWVPDSTGYVLDEWQKRLIRNLFIGGNQKPGSTIMDWGPGKKARLSCKACHGSGKSFMAGIVTHFFLCNYIRSIVCITGITGKQTSKQIWGYVSEIWNRSVFKEDLDLFGTTMRVVPAPKSWYATWVTSKEPRSIEGFHGPEDSKNLLWIVEESKGVADAVFEAIQGALSAEHNYWYISSTCGTAHGFFFDTFYSKKEEWENISVPYYESTRISAEQVRKWEKAWEGKDSSRFRARALAEFPEEDDKVIVPQSWFQRAIVYQEDDDLGEAA